MNRLVKVCIALAAFAALAVLPATASAENDVTLWKVVNGVHTEVEPLGSNIVAKGNHDSYNVLTDANKNPLITCTTTEITGTLKKNDHTAVEGEITAASLKGTAGTTPDGIHCGSNLGHVLFNLNPAVNGLPWCLQARAIDATDSFRVKGGACGAAVRPIRIEFIATTILGNVTCKLQRNEPVTGTYETATTPTLSVTHSEFVRIESPAVCPAVVFLDLRTRLHTDNPAGEVALTNAT